MEQNKNDLVIEKLQEKIAQKEKELVKVDRNQITNWVLESFILPKAINIHTLNTNDLALLLSYLMCFYDWDLVINWFTIDDYISDITNKLAMQTYKDKLKDIKTLKDKLHQLMSDDKKKALELDSLESLIDTL